MARRTVLRSELYQRVWSVPINRIAPELGLSDAGLAKVCRRFKIPTPPRGYWARLKFGKAVKRVPLPPSDTQSQVVAWVVERPSQILPALAGRLCFTRLASCHR